MLVAAMFVRKHHLFNILERFGNIRRPLPTAGGARQRRNYQQQGPRSHYKQQGQEARKHERRSKKQEAITGNKRQEARNKKPGSNKRLEDRSEKSLQTARARRKKTRKKKQEAITSNKRQEARNKKPGSNKRVEDRSEKQETRSQEATSGWKTGQRASFLVDSESNVRQAAGRQVRELVFLSIQKATLGRRLEDSSES